MTRLTAIAVILFCSGCVSIREAKRYGEVKYFAGKLEGSVEGFERGKKFGRLFCTKERVRSFENKVDALDSYFKALAEESAKKTDRKLLCCEQLDEFMEIE